ncbi:MAG: glycosyltransferase family 2 protein, partial [Desulfobacterales bacterium]|nr:glycosyltransferase family 2 protein [Desulfobacterales bacterium]
MHPLDNMKISVIIPVYNAETFIEEAVQSALGQPETGEVILIEDGSTDNSLTVCRELEKASSRVRLLRHPGGGNRGAGPSRNLGILNATYDYIAFLDADDFYLPGRFAAASQIFAQDPLIDGVYGATGIHFETESAREAWRNSPLHRGRMITTMKGRIPPDRLFHALASESGKGV